MKNNKKFQFAIYVGALTFIVFILVSLVIIRPLYLSIAKKEAERKSKQANLDYLIDKKAKLESLKDQEEKLKNDAKQVEGALPSKEEVGRLFIQFDETAAQSGGSLKSVSQSNLAGSTSAVGTSNIVTKTYASTGDFPTYFNLKEFIAKNESALRIIDITSFNIDASATGAVSTSVTANTFVRNNE